MCLLLVSSVPSWFLGPWVLFGIQKKPGWIIIFNSKASDGLPMTSPHRSLLTLRPKKSLLKPSPKRSMCSRSKNNLPSFSSLGLAHTLFGVLNRKICLYTCAGPSHFLLALTTLDRDPWGNGWLPYTNTFAGLRRVAFRRRSHR